MAWTQGLSVASVFGISWTTQTSNSTRPHMPVGAVSRESRFNHIYPKTEALGQVPFVWRIQSQYPFYIASGNQVFIRSSITETIAPY